MTPICVSSSSVTRRVCRRGKNKESKEGEFRLCRYSRELNIAVVLLELIQPILLFELFGKVALGQILKILVGERIELEL
jgi:hypothetical protein